MRRGQSTLEYSLLIGIAAAGIIAMLTYINRSHQGYLRSQADQLGAGQYAPDAVINNQQIKTLTSKTSGANTTTVTHGNLNESNTALEAVLEAIVLKWKEVYALRQAWEELVVPEALAGAAAVRGGSFDWVPPVPGLKEKYASLKTVNEELNDLYDQAEKLAKDWPERTKNKTTSGSSSSEEGTVITHKDISETLGAF